MQGPSQAERFRQGGEWAREGARDSKLTKKAGAGSCEASLVSGRQEPR